MHSMKQLWLLIQKNLILRRRHWIISSFEVLLPVLVAIILLLIRTRLPSNGIAAAKTWKDFDATSVPSILNDTRNRFKVAFVPNSALAKSLALEILDKTSPYVSGKFPLFQNVAVHENSIHILQIYKNIKTLFCLHSITCTCIIQITLFIKQSTLCMYSNVL